MNYGQEKPLGALNSPNSKEPDLFGKDLDLILNTILSQEEQDDDDDDFQIVMDDNYEFRVINKKKSKYTNEDIIELWNDRDFFTILYIDDCECVQDNMWALPFYQSACYRYGYGLHHIDIKTADELYKKSFENLKLAAESGNADAQNAYGGMLWLSGEYDCSINWLEKAASQKHGKAICNLATFYLSGKIPRNKERALELLEEGVCLNIPDCMRTLAVLYVRGTEVSRNLDVAKDLIFKALKCDDKYTKELVGKYTNESFDGSICVDLLIALDLQSIEASNKPSVTNDTVSFGIALPSDSSDKENREWLKSQVNPNMKVPKPASRIEIKMPDLNSANPSFAARLILYVRDRFDDDAPQVYHAAGISRKTYSAIVTNELRPVSKRTAIAFAFALKLSPPEFKAFIASAGYALSSSILEDIIYKACLSAGIYNLSQISKILVSHGEKPLENVSENAE